MSTKENGGEKTSIQSRHEAEHDEDHIHNVAEAKHPFAFMNPDRISRQLSCWSGLVGKVTTKSRSIPILILLLVMGMATMKQVLTFATGNITNYQTHFEAASFNAEVTVAHLRAPKEADGPLTLQGINEWDRTSQLANSEESISEAWSESVLFHVTTNGSRVEGSFFQKRNAKMSRSFWRSSKVGCDQAFLETFRPRRDERVCYWCPAESEKMRDCLQGRLSLTRHSRDDQPHQTLEYLGLSKYLAERSFTSPNYSSTVHPMQFYTVALTCDFQSSSKADVIPFERRGTLIVKAEKVMRFDVAKRRDQSAGRSNPRNVVCVKNAYGQPYRAQMLLAFSTFYLREWEFDAIVLYELGVTFRQTTMDLIQSDSRLRELYIQGKFIVVDLRDALQRLYGLLYQDIVLFSSVLGQLLTIDDCFSRGRANHAQWALSVDIDEYITFGRDHVKRPWNWQGFIEDKARLLMSPQRLFMVRFPKLHVNESLEDSLCNVCGAESVWDESAAAEFHRNEELTSIFRSKDSAKYALRLDNGLPSVVALGMHYFQPPCPNFTTVPANELWVEGTDAYIRHYRRCGNGMMVGEKCRSNDSADFAPASWNWFDF